MSGVFNINSKPRKVPRNILQPTDPYNLKLAGMSSPAVPAAAPAAVAAKVLAAPQPAAAPVPAQAPAIAAPAAAGPSTSEILGRHVSALFDRATYLYQNTPAGTAAAVTGAALAYYASSDATVAAIGGVVGAVAQYAGPRFAKMGVAKLAASFPNNGTLQSLSHRAQLQPLVVKLLQDAGVNDQDLKSIDMSALTDRMAPLSEDARKTFIYALAELKRTGLLDAISSAEIIASRAPLELAQTRSTYALVFLPGPRRAAVVTSDQPQAMAEAFTLLMKAQLLDKDNNLAFVATVLDMQALVGILGVLSTANILTEATFNQVKAHANLASLAEGLQTLARAGLLKNDNAGLFSGKGLLEGLTQTGPTKNGECFGTVISHPNPRIMAQSLAELKLAGLLKDRENFLAVIRSLDPDSMASVLTQLPPEAVRKHPNTQALASILRILNDHGKANPGDAPLVNQDTKHALIRYPANKLQELAHAIILLNEGKALGLLTLISVHNAVHPVAIAQIYSILKESNILDARNIEALFTPNEKLKDLLSNPARLEELEQATKLLKDSGILHSISPLNSPGQQFIQKGRMDYLFTTLLSSPTPLVLANEIVARERAPLAAPAPALAPAPAVAAPAAAAQPVASRRRSLVEWINYMGARGRVPLAAPAAAAPAPLPEEDEFHDAAEEFAVL